MNNHKNNRGFTLIEIMVTLAIVGIFASIALPSFARLIESNRVTRATNELVANLLLTRSEALKRRNVVTICPSNDQINCQDSKDFSTGWIVFLDCGAIGVQNAGTIIGCGDGDEEEIIKVGDSLDSIYMTNKTNNAVSFGLSGRISGNPSTFEIGKDSSNKKKEVILSRVGRVKVELL